MTSEQPSRHTEKTKPSFLSLYTSTSTGDAVRRDAPVVGNGFGRHGGQNRID
jgi:hypothetical protein